MSVGAISIGGLLWAADAVPSADEVLCRTPAGYLRIATSGQCGRREVVVEFPVGPQGPVGPAGERGDQGLPGLNGQDGKDGKDGRDGTDSGSAIRVHNGYLIYAGANLVNALLSAAPLSQASLDYVKMTNADLSDADFSQAHAHNALFANASLLRANLSDASLKFSNFVNADLSQANLSRSDFTGALLGSGTNLSNAVVEGLLFPEAIGHGVIVNRVVGTPARLPNGWNTRDGFLFGPHVVFNPGTAVQADLRSANLTGSTVAGNFTEADFRGSSLFWSRLQGQFNSANLSGANLALATLPAHLTGTDLSGADLRMTSGGAYWSNINATHANFGELGIENCPSGWYKELPDGNRAYGCDPSRWLSGRSSMVAITVQQSNFSEANLHGVDFTYASFRASDLTNTDLRGTQFQMTYFEGVNLSGAKFGGATLASTAFVACDVTGADFSGTNLDGLVTMGLTGTPLALPPGWELVNGSFVRT